MIDSELNRLGDEELLENIRAYQAEIIQRKKAGYKVIDGFYEVGSDIPAGNYRVELIGEMGCSCNLQVFSVHEYIEDSEKPKGKKAVEPRVGLCLDDDRKLVGKVPLYEGEKLHVFANWQPGFLVFSKYMGLEIYIRADDEISPIAKT